MNTLMPESELRRKAIEWIHDAMDKNDHHRPVHFIEQAAVRFNLSPLDAEFLQRFFTENSEKKANQSL